MTIPSRQTSLASSALVISDGEKGGAGKSFALRALADAVFAKGVELRGYDADVRNSHLARFYDRTFPVERLYLRDQSGWNQLIDGISQVGPEVVILLDLPANIGETLAKEMPRLQLACERLHRTIYRQWTIDGEYDSVAQLAASRDVVPFERTFVTMNGLFGSPSDFTIWQDSKLQKEFLTADGIQLYLPAMPGGIRSRVSAARCSFAAAVDLDLTLSQRIDLECWRASVQSTFASVLARMGL